MIQDGIKLFTLADILRKCKLTTRSCRANCFFYFVLLGLVSCTNSSQTKYYSNDNELNDPKSNTLVVKSDRITRVIGPFVWGIPDDSFYKFNAEWEKELKVGDFKELYGLKLISNGVIPHYDCNGHLEAIDIQFVRFYISTECNLSDSEMTELKKNFFSYNRKIETLIRELTEIYGTANYNNFDVDSDFIFSTSTEADLAMWTCTDTQVILKYSNTITENSIGCDFKMTLHLKRII